MPQAAPAAQRVRAAAVRGRRLRAGLPDGAAAGPAGVPADHPGGHGHQVVGR